MRQILLTILATCYFFNSYGQNTTSDSLFKNINKINGQWIWFRSWNATLGISTPETEKTQIKLIIKDNTKIEIYQNDTLVKSAKIKLYNIKDKTISRNSKTIWEHYTINYSIIYEAEKVKLKKKNLNRELRKIHSTIFTDWGTFELWDNDFLNIANSYISGQTISSFKKIN